MKMKNKKMKTISNPMAVTQKSSTENPNLACNICGVDVKTTINFHNHLIKDHSKLDLSFCILEMLNLIVPSNGVKTNPLTRKSNSPPSIKKNRPNLKIDVTASKLLHLDEVMNLRNVCSDVNLNLSGAQNAKSLSNQSRLQQENVCQKKGERARNSPDSSQKALERTPKHSETSSRNSNEPYTDEQTLFFNQLGLCPSPNQVSVAASATADVESTKKLLYNQLESFNFRIPIKFFAEDPVSEENCASELSRSQLLRAAPESELSEASNSNLVLTAEYDLSLQQPKNVAPLLGSCLNGERPTTQHIRLNRSSELLSLVSQKNPVNQPSGIVSGMSAATGTSSQSNVSKFETTTHSIKLSDRFESNKFSVSSSLNLDSSLSKQTDSTGLSESCLSPIQNRLSENPKGTNNEGNLGIAVHKKHFSTCNPVYDKCPVYGPATVVRTGFKIKSRSKKCTQNALTTVKNKLGAVKKTEVKAVKVISVSTETEKVDFEQNACLTGKSSSQIAPILGRNVNQTADKSVETKSNFDIVSSFIRSLVNNDATNLKEKIGLSNFNVKENLNLGDTVVCENSRSLIQNVKLVQEKNVPEIIEKSRVPQSGKLQIRADNEFVRRSTNGLKNVSQRDEVIWNNEISQASESSDSFRDDSNLCCGDAQTCTIADLCSKPDILLEKNYSKEVFGAKTNIEPHSNKALKKPAVPFLVDSNGVIWNVCGIQNSLQPSKVAKPAQVFNFGVMPHLSPVNVSNLSDTSKASEAKQAKKNKAQITGKRSVKPEAFSVESKQNLSAKKKRKKKSKVNELKAIKIDNDTHETLNGSKSLVQKFPNLLMPLSDPSAEVSQASSSSSSVILNRSYCDSYSGMECSREISDNSNLSTVSSGAASDLNTWNGADGLSYETGSQIKSDCLHPMTLCQQKMTVDDVSEIGGPDNGEEIKRHLRLCSFKFQGENNLVPHCGNTSEKGTQCLESSIWNPFPQNGENGKVCEKRRRPYCCDVCGKNYSRKNHLIRHCRMHLNERPYECDICHKSFTTSSILKQHQRLHSGERPFVCPVCDKTFTQKSSLLTHSMLHSGKPFKCYFCRFAVVSNHKLQRHLKRHYISDSGLYCCVCEYRFGLEGSFREHLAEVHGYSSVNNVELGPNSKSRRRVRKNYGGPIE